MATREPREAASTSLMPHAWAHVLRFGGYTLIVLAFVLVLHLLSAGMPGASAFREGGPIELLQLGLLAASVAMFFWISYRCGESQPAALLLAIAASLALVRELDSLFDSVVPLGLGWQFPAGILLLWGATYAWRRRPVLLARTPDFVLRGPIGLLWAAVIVVVVQGQMIGDGRLLQAALGENYHRDMKRIVQESSEALGYCLLFIGSIECSARAPAAAPEATLQLPSVAAATRRREEAWSSASAGSG